MTTLALLTCLLAPADVPLELTAEVTAAPDRYEVVLERLKSVRVGMTLKEVDAAVGVRPDWWYGQPSQVCWFDLGERGARSANVHFKNGVVSEIRIYPRALTPDKRAEQRKNLARAQAQGQDLPWPPPQR